MSMTAAETRNDPDVVDLLLEQHDEIKRLFSQLQRVEGPGRRELVEDLVRLLAVHDTAQETVVHPVARRKLEADEQVVEQRLEEEDRAKKQLPTSTTWAWTTRSSAADWRRSPPR
jgi:hypothetical protein